MEEVYDLYCSRTPGGNPKYLACLLGDVVHLYLQSVRDIGSTGHVTGRVTGHVTPCSLSAHSSVWRQEVSLLPVSLLWDRQPLFLKLWLAECFPGQPQLADWRHRPTWWSGTRRQTATLYFSSRAVCRTQADLRIHLCHRFTYRWFFLDFLLWRQINLPSATCAGSDP